MNYTALWTVLYGIFVTILIGTGLDRVFVNPVISLILIGGVMLGGFLIRDPISASKGLLYGYAVYTSFALAAISSFLIHFVAYKNVGILIAALVTTFLLGGAIVFAARTVQISMDKAQAITKFLLIVGIAAFIASILNVFIFKSGIFGIVITAVFLVWSVAALFITLSQIDNIEMMAGDNPELLDRLALWFSVDVFILLYNIFITILQLLLAFSSDND
jgi:FtsH-binding integral membrane protein